jgi:hypothetical protein
MMEKVDVTFSASPRDDATMLQAMEMGADNAASGLTIHRLLEQLPAPDRLWTVWFPTHLQKMVLWSFAIHGLFRLWLCSPESRSVSMELDDHPPMPMRLLMAMQTAHAVVKDTRPLLADDFKNACQYGGREIDAAIELIGGKKIAVSKIAEVITPEGQAQYSAVRRYMYEKLLPGLDPIARLRFPTFQVSPDGKVNRAPQR